MRFELVSPHGRGGSRLAPATPGEIAAIVAALEALAPDDAPSVDARASDGFAWKRAGRTYDAYDVSRAVATSR